MNNFINIRDTYSHYYKESTSPVDKAIYVDILNKFMQFIANKFLETGEVTLPERMGTLRIRGHKVIPKIVDNKIKGLAINWKETKKLWEEDKEAKETKKLVYYFNDNTNNIMYRVHWYRARVLASNKIYYDFKLTRTNKRLLSKLIQQGKEYLYG
jgi:hypothetical protein